MDAGETAAGDSRAVDLRLPGRACGLAGVWAHSPNGARKWHALTDHLRGTAALAGRFAAPFGGEETAWWLGLLHDTGKASCGWQNRLREVAGTGQRVRLDHKMLGTRLAQERGLGSFAMAIAGHHGGLESAQTVRERLQTLTDAERARDADAASAVDALLPELTEGTRIVLPPTWQQPLIREMALRLCFSALCDADYLDTSAHACAAERPAVRPDADFAALCAQYEGRRKNLLSGRPPSVTGAARDQVYRACLRAANATPGIFRLAAPTGAGKTIGAGGFALHHAAEHGLRRVIVAVPFLTITEQTAQVYRDLLDPAGSAGVVLEHHSGVDLDQPPGPWAKLAAENWDAPFVVTTTVRLFDSLFHRKPAAMRRLHRLAGTVIVLDEVQSLPHQLLVPILDALRTLTEHFGTTVLLASATQPDFWHLSPFRDLPATEIIAEPAVLARRLRRVSFEWRLDPSPDLARLAADAAGHEQAMVVVNTTADARTVFTAWRDILPRGTGYHLSARMCAAHRRRVLDEVRGRLDAGKPVLLVATQLIEAGVDVDFPVVYRVIAPADSLLQAAGRANREGNLPGLGTVIIVDPPDAHHPPAYRKLLAETRIHFGPGKADPDNQAALRAYYQTVYGSLNLEYRGSTGQQIQEARRRLDFETVRDGPADPQTRERDRTRAFRMITDEGVTLVTPQGAAGADERAAIQDLADQVRTAARPQRRDLRRLQPYMTSVHTSALRQAGVAALMRPILGEPGQPGSLAEWTGRYDPDTGIDPDPHTEEFPC